MENEEITQYILLQSKILDRCRIIAKYVIDNDLKFKDKINNKWEIETFTITNNKINIIIDEFPAGQDVHIIDLDITIFMSLDYMTELTYKVNLSNDKYRRILEKKKLVKRIKHNLQEKIYER